MPNKSFLQLKVSTFIVLYEQSRGMYSNVSENCETPRFHQ